MDDLLRDFVIETNETIEVVDNELVRFEQDPNNSQILAQVFRLVHTIKGTCGFLGLPRLETLTHAAESVIGRFRDGAPVTRDAVSLILETVDRIKLIMAELDKASTEPSGSDDDLIARLDNLDITEPAKLAADPSAGDVVVGNLIYQVLERPLKPGEVSLDELEQAFRTADGPEWIQEQATLAVASTSEVKKDNAARPVAAVDTNHRRHAIRVPIERLDHLMTMVSELVLTRNQLIDISRQDTNARFHAPLQRLSQVTAELQDSVMQTRMQPIGTGWTGLPRIVRDLSLELGKDIEIEMQGGETGIDRQLLELIKDPIMHMIRNAADHGIETREQRIAAGKTERGRIMLSAEQKSGHIIVAIADDGRGIDVAAVRAKAVQNGLATAKDAEIMPDSKMIQFIFAAGFSTAASVTNVSGRGVGMDVVRANIEQIGGSVDLSSQPGKGTRIEVRIPLTLAIASALIVRAGNETFALPQTSVIELVRAGVKDDARFDIVNGMRMLRLRERLMPVLDLPESLGLSAGKAGEGFIVICQVSNVRFGLMVDAILETEEVVVKPVSAQLRSLSLFSGVTIMGDGSVVMILDPNGLLLAIGQSPEAHNDNADAIDVSALHGGTRMSLLVFKAGNGAPKALPLALINRLEDIPVERIEVVGDSRVVQYRGGIMELLHCAEQMELKAEGNQAVLVFTQSGRPVGIMIDAIVDIAEVDLVLSPEGARAGVLGTTVIHERTTDLLDLAAYIPEAASGGEARTQRKKSVLLIEPNDMLRGLLIPVLQAAKFEVIAYARLEDARLHRGAELPEYAIVNIEKFDALTVRQELPAKLKLIGTASRASASILNQAREASFSDVVAVFDREGLLRALNAGSNDMGAAA
jgi:two-component system, chemotaxis family, sensor kinase CheA